MGALKDWVKQDWVQFGTDGKIKGKCGTSKDKKIQTDVCQDPKLIAYHKKKELPLQKRKARGVKGQNFCI